ncbi:hypothetical protein AVEN_56909-1 [Araneus ventricosus]|uniref:Reverse transcriptase domain-containing protein n=1 Tax=Araneus ventricosus TaxID=182803 RepID=A0A4Y2EUX6_ARAVE|nr:hypothetical protein AVEN_56909-1 [Araneus ventricosus]
MHKLRVQRRKQEKTSFVGFRMRRDCFQNLEQVFQRLNENGLVLNIEKCIFGADKLPFLGCEVSKDGISPSKEKFEALVNYPQPQDNLMVLHYIAMFLQETLVLMSRKMFRTTIVNVIHSLANSSEKSTANSVKQRFVPDSNFSLQQACYKFDMTRVQACDKFDMKREQACNKLTQASKSPWGEFAGSLPQAFRGKLIVNYSKNRVQTQPRNRTRNLPLGSLPSKPLGQLVYERRR